ncbi:unnamed protein product [Auanema sp. JU1783]|nr:unnamed protein product [Auanema sp. JU1783]
MEGMPRLPDIEPILKLPMNEYDDTFDLQLKEYILLHYQADPHVFEDAFKEIKNMKRNINTNYCDVETTCVLKRYFSQILMMKNRFPMESGDQICIPFSWQDQITESTAVVTHYDINYELACIMYQIGAVHSHIASEQPRTEEDSIKNAFMHFQYAAFPFQYMRDNMELAKFNCLDFDKDLLTFYVNILLAQAQECLVQKSVNDHRKHLIVAKLTIYLKELYKSCLNHIDKNLSGGISPKKYKLWATLCFMKMEMYACMTMLYMGMNSEEETKYGFRLGYYKIAKTHFDNMVSAYDKNLFDLKDSIQFLSDVVNGKLKNADDENRLIYHERVPSAEELQNNSVEGLCKVKPLGFDPLDPSIGGEDIFSTLLPPSVLATVSEYEDQKAKLRREIMQEIEEKNEELQTFLIALNVNELGLNEGSEDFHVPDILLERNASLASQPDAVPKILQELQGVNERSLQAETKISCLQDRLAAIDLPELKSDEGYQAISKEVSRLNDHHLQARTNNGELHKALAAHSANLHLLTLPLYELRNKLYPCASNPGSTEEGLVLKKYLDKVEEMINQRSKLSQRLSGELDSDDISKRLLAERDTNCKHIFEKELKKHDQTIQYIRLNLTAQEKILNGLTEANADFAEHRQKIQEGNIKRSEQITDLVQSFDVYSDVCEKVDEGKRFYEKLLDRVDRLGIAVKGMESAYAEEKQKREGEMRALEEKMKALRAAQEARSALSDFALGPNPGMVPNSMDMGRPSPVPSIGSSGGRGRIGDYKEFFRSKMGLPQNMGNVTPVTQLSVQQDHFPSGGSTQPPSPAPSSVCDFHFSPTVERPPVQNSNQHYYPGQYQQPQDSISFRHIPTTAPQHAPQHVPQHAPQHAPQHVPQHVPQHAPQHAPQHVPQHAPQHVPQHVPVNGNIVSMHSNGYLPSTQRLDGPTSVAQGQNWSSQPVSQNFYNQFPTDVTYAATPQMDWRNTPFTGNAQQFNGPVINQQQPQVPMTAHHPHQQDILRPSNITQGPPLPSASFSGTNTSVPQRPYVPPVPTQLNNSIYAPHQRTNESAAQQFSSNSYGMTQVSNIQTYPISQPVIQQHPAVASIPSVPQQPTIPKTSPSQQPNNGSINHGVPGKTGNYQSPYANYPPYSASPSPHVPPANPGNISNNTTNFHEQNKQPTAPTAQPMYNGSSFSTPMNQSFNTNPSPWHKTVPQNPSPWHGNASNTCANLPVTQVYQAPTTQQTFAVQPSNVNSTPATQAAPQSNLDLLSSLLGPIDSTPAIQPIPAGQSEMRCKSSSWHFDMLSH